MQSDDIAVSYRTQDAPISSQALFDPARFAGEWFTVASYPTPPYDGCVVISAQYGVTPDGDLTVRRSCHEVDDSTIFSNGIAKVSGPGRLQVATESGEDEQWVLWVDTGYRTAVIGAPDGQIGWIINRTAKIPSDRMQAAREVLKFNGYDLAELMEVPQ